jgi:hypothetical protein
MTDFEWFNFIITINTALPLTELITLYQCYLQTGIMYPYDGVLTLIALHVWYFDLEIKTVAVWFILTILA